MIPEGKFKDFLRHLRRTAAKVHSFPKVGKLALGDLDRATPISNNWGFERGTPIDRRYVEEFVSECSNDIRGRVLEVYNDDYASRFGGDRVAHLDILHDKNDLDRATVVFDLANPDDAPPDVFDCFICTQTLHLIFDVSAVVESIHNVLKPNGVLLLTVPGISASPTKGLDVYSDYWRFTSSSIYRLFARHFGEAQVDVRTYGNVYAATAFLHGLALQEVDADKLAFVDRDYEMVIALRAVKTSRES